MEVVVSSRSSSRSSSSSDSSRGSSRGSSSSSSRQWHRQLRLSSDDDDRQLAVGVHDRQRHERGSLVK